MKPASRTPILLAPAVFFKGVRDVQAHHARVRMYGHFR